MNVQASRLLDGAQRPEGAEARGRGPLRASRPMGEGLATAPRGKS
jgi:hypothetical protein